MKSYETKCHCGAVTVVLTRPIRKLTRCNCSICRRYGALWAYQQRKAISVMASDNALRTYTWGNKMLEFSHCAKCGSVTYYHHADQRLDGSDMSAVNMRNTTDPARIADLPIRLLDGAGSWKVLEEREEPYLLCAPPDEVVQNETR